MPSPNPNTFFAATHSAVSSGRLSRTDSRMVSVTPIPHSERQRSVGDTTCCAVEKAIKKTTAKNVLTIVYCTRGNNSELAKIMCVA